jgi:hypothetical protein
MFNRKRNISHYGLEKKSHFTLRFEIDSIFKRVVNALCILFVCFLCCPQFDVKKKTTTKKKKKINRSIDDEKRRLTRFRSLFSYDDEKM